MIKRVAKWVGLAVLVFVAVTAFRVYSAFAHNKPVVDGQELQPGVRTVKDGFVSVFMLDAGDGKVVLIDAGNDKHAAAILAELARRKLDANAVVGIFLTHGHGDHTNGIRMFPKAEVYALAAEVDRIGSDAKSVHTIVDGEKTTIGDLVIETFATPGHTIGSAVYLARGVLFFGDSAGASDENVMTPAVRLFSSDSAQNVASLKTLATKLSSRPADIKVLAFAHCGPLDGLTPLATFATTH